MGLHRYVACDLGAESCRVMLGTLDDDHLVTEEIHRFVNDHVTVLGTLRWDVLCIFNELKKGLREVAARGYQIESISTDSWGTDYVYVGAHEPMITCPYHYRDPRTDGVMERAFTVVPAELIYLETGGHFVRWDTVYQMVDDLENRAEILEFSDQFLNMGDYFNYLFSGVGRSEQSLASTTQLFNPKQRQWSRRLIEGFGLPSRIFPEVVPSGTTLGALLPSIAAEVGLRDTQVVAGCSHDTACAVAAVPAEGRDWSYVSSGTWSVMGIEAAQPIINPKSREYNFTNELGYGGTVRIVKNLAGLWLVRECRRQWAKEGQECTYDQLTKMAQESEPLKSLINPGAPRFIEPDNIPEKISYYCRETNQEGPKTPGETIRCILESLALLYRHTLREIVAVTGREASCFHIVGGGSKNQLLNQLAADATQLTVLAGPSEATAIGNLLIQAIALGHLGSLEDLRRTVRGSFPIMTYQPREPSTWQKAYERFRKLVATSQI